MTWITCEVCGELKGLYAHNMCGDCYRKDYYQKPEVRTRRATWFRDYYKRSPIRRASCKFYANRYWEANKEMISTREKQKRVAQREYNEHMDTMWSIMKGEHKDD